MSVNSSPKIAEKSHDSANGQELYDLNVLCEDIDAEARKVWEDSGAVHGHEPELENKSYDITDKIKNRDICAPINLTLVYITKGSEISMLKK